MRRFDAEERETPRWEGWERKRVPRFAIHHGEQLYPVKQILGLATGRSVQEFKGGEQTNNIIKRHGLEIVSLRQNEPFATNQPLSNLDGANAAVHRDWAFQANPDVYDIEKAAQHLPELTWSVQQHRKHIGPGDRVFIWRSGRDAGLVAVATCLTSPEPGGSDPAEAPYFRRPQDARLHRVRVRLKIDRVLQPAVSRSRLLAHPELQSVSVFKGMQGTNFPLTASQANAILSLAGEPVVMEAFVDFKSLMTGIQSQGLSFAPELVSNYLLALQTKRFVILSGISGTGKTRLAIEVARHFRKVARGPGQASASPDRAAQKAQKYNFEDSRIGIPVELWNRLKLPDANRGNPPKVELSYPDGQAQVSAYAKRRTVQFQSKSEIKAWFDGHLKPGETFYLDFVDGEGTGSSGLRLSLPGQPDVEETFEDTYQVVAVRPDWTDNRGLLGYHNPIIGAYHATPTLRLLLRAALEYEAAKKAVRDPHPYFLILDEMNLARVEHYFSDFLSCLEFGGATPSS